MRLLLSFLLVLSLTVPADAGVLKWLGRGAAVCAMNSGCSGAVTKGVAKGSLRAGAYLAKKYGRHLAQRCMASPECMSYATAASGLLAGTAAGLAGKEALETWMENNGGGDIAGGSGSDASGGAGTGNPDPDDPFGDGDKDGKEPVIGKKLDYLFGKATGRDHNLTRTSSMLRELNKAGLKDTPEVREMIRRKLIETYNDPASISKVEGKWITRETFVMGPRGGVRLDSVWIKNELKSIIVKGGK